MCIISTLMRNCAFCNLEIERVLVESDSCVAFSDKFPVSLGHTLVIPKTHMENYFNLSSFEKNSIWELVDQVKVLLVNKYSPDGFNVGINIGEQAGQTVFHCHIHVIPRYKGDTEDPRGGVRGVIPVKQKY